MFSMFSLKRPVLLSVISTILLSVIITGFLVFKTSAAHADTVTTDSSSSKFVVKVLVFTMFSDETQPWLSNEQWPLTFKVPGAFSNVYCQQNGLCLTTIGEAKSNAGPSATAILLNSQFSFKDTYFLTAGIAGTSPDVGTLGFAAWAKWVVDWDLGNHLDPDTATDVPYGWLPNTYYGTAVYHLNETLTNLAYTVTSQVQLQDDATAIAARQKYPSQVDLHPYVAMCDTITGDDFWAGKRLSEEAQYITSQLTDNQGKYCTGEQEDTAVATVLQRTGHLDHYLNLRTASDFDQPYSGETMQELLSTYPGGDISIANAYLVGSKMAHYLLTYKG